MIGDNVVCGLKNQMLNVSDSHLHFDPVRAKHCAILVALELFIDHLYSRVCVDRHPGTACKQAFTMTPMGVHKSMVFNGLPASIPDLAEDLHADVLELYRFSRVFQEGLRL